MSGATATWNSWRGWDLSREPNLTGADLRRADLPRTDLTGANLAGADLSGADLVQAILVGAVLTGADLSTASLTQPETGVTSYTFSSTGAIETSTRSVLRIISYTPDGMDSNAKAPRSSVAVMPSSLSLCNSWTLK